MTATAIAASADLISNTKSGRRIQRPEGLAVAPDVYPEANRGCRGETVIVPWESVRETLLKPIVMP